MRLNTRRNHQQIVHGRTAPSCWTKQLWELHVWCTCTGSWSSPIDRRTWKGSASAAVTPFSLIALSLKRCLTVSIYDNRPLRAYWNNSAVTRRAESWSLSWASPTLPTTLHHPAFSLFTRRRGGDAADALVNTGWRGLRAWLVVESEGGLSNATETHDWKEEMVDRELPLLTQIGVGGKTQVWWKEPAGWRTWRSENATIVAAAWSGVVHEGRRSQPSALWFLNASDSSRIKIWLVV